MCLPYSAAKYDAKDYKMAIDWLIYLFIDIMIFCSILDHLCHVA